MPISEQEASRLYDMCDSNKDGVVTRLELCKGLREYFGRSISTDEVTDVFNGLDEDGDNKISKEEFINQLCKKVNRREAFAQAFNEIDKNKDGTLSPDELKQVCRKCGFSDDEVMQMIKSIDQDGDGQISLKEFMTLV